MNNEMDYLLGMICGNGGIKRGNTETIVSIDIPHKKIQTESLNDVKLYVKASIVDIRSIIAPLVGADLQFTQDKRATLLSFRKPNNEYSMREVLRFVGNASSHENIRINSEVFRFTRDEKLQFLRGFSDVTGYIRRSNYFFDKSMHRVYLEIPHNWGLVIDICNLLKQVDIPVQNIDWAHPNIRDGNLTKYNQGYPNFWKKEHQIKIWANEFETIGFAVIHKMEALDEFANELIKGIELQGKKVADITHRYYWEGKNNKKVKPYHPCESDDFIPAAIRGKHYNSWKDIAKDLGYAK